MASLTAEFLLACAHTDGKVLPEDVAEALAHVVDGLPTQEQRGALMQLLRYSELTGRPLTPALVSDLTRNVALRGLEARKKSKSSDELADEFRNTHAGHDVLRFEPEHPLGAWLIRCETCGVGMMLPGSDDGETHELIH
jgi:hypothetical protein